jgi:hypothetical protein
MDDKINPKHYCQGSQELIETFENTMRPEQFRGAMKFNIVKYTHRYQEKGGLIDLKKAKWYLDRLIANEEKWAAEAESEKKYSEYGE